MATLQVIDIHKNSPSTLTVFLPGWADEASTLPHPAPLIESAESALCRELTCLLPNFGALPGAQCLWRESSGSTSAPEHLVCASPVHVIAGSDDAQLLPVNRLNLTLDETRTMIAELNEALAENSCSFLHDEKGNWYYKGLLAAALDAAPPTAVEGLPMTLAMPRSNEARPWRSLWSESQMVLHQSSVNQARQSRGEPLINSVWFWGGGAMPNPVATSVPHIILFTDDPFACGLADAIGVKRLALDQVDQLDLAESNYRRHIVLDTSLMHGNPDFIEQRDHGSQWCERVMNLVGGSAKVEAELNGLTGCREVFMPKAANSSSFFSRLASVFKS